MSDKSKTSTIAFRIDEETKIKLQHAAVDDRRSLSQYILVVLTDHLKTLEAEGQDQDAI